MARVPYVDRSDRFPDYNGAKQRNITRALMNSPVIARRMLAIGEYLRDQSTLDKRLRELAIVKIGCLTGSAYDYASHVRAALALGVSEEDIRAVTSGDTSSLDSKTVAVLDCVRELVETEHLSDKTFQAAAKHLPTDAMIDLLVTISIYRGIEMLVAALDLELEPQYQEYLDRFPMP